MIGDFPKTLGRYGIRKRLGRGGMAEVFLAKSVGAEGLEKILVVKRILPSFSSNAKFIAMFVNEAKVAMRLNHPAIVQVYAFEQVRNEFLLAMEFVDGLDLGRLMNIAREDARPIPPGIAAYVAREVARGLDYAHRRRDESGDEMEIVHRDVSPQNILLSRDGVVKVTDFGIAKARLVSEQSGIIKGKFSYMSPEQARGDLVDLRSDIYSLGVVLAEMLMGRPMYPGLQGLDVLERVRLGMLTYPSEVDAQIPLAIDRIVRKATAENPANRYATARDLADDLARFLHDEKDVHDAVSLERFVESFSPSFPADDEPAQSSVPTMPTELAVHRAERRQIVLVSGRVSGASLDREARISDRAVVKILADIAFKADAVLSWPDRGGGRFRLIVGLGQTTEQDALVAVRLAEDVIEALGGVSADREEPLTAFLGLARGIVSATRDANGRLIRHSTTGDVQLLADRLAEVGRANEILVAGQVRRLADRGFAFETADADVTLDVAGEGRRNLQVYRLQGPRTRAQRDRSPEHAPIGREVEIRQIDEAYEGCCQERRTTFLRLVGDLGVGITTIISSAIRNLWPSPRVIRVECAFGSSEVPYATLIDIVRETCTISDDLPPPETMAKLSHFVESLTHDRGHRQRLADGLAPLVLSARPATLRSDPMPALQAARDLIRLLSRVQPLCIVIDSIQWCDTSSLELLRLMWRRPESDPCFVILAGRDDPRVERILGDVLKIRVAELPPEAARRLLHQQLGAEPPAEVAQAVLERAGGNPYFIIELVDALLERGALVVEVEGQRARAMRNPSVPMSLPASLAGVVAARIDALSERERTLLRWLAVAEVGVHRRDLDAMTGADIETPLTELVERAFVFLREGHGYHIATPVIRQVAYETTDPRDRARMHRRVADRLVWGGNAPPAVIGRHFELAGDLESAAAAYVDAGDEALELHSNRSALAFFDRALTYLPPQAPERVRALLGRERVYRLLGHSRERFQDIAELRHLVPALEPALKARALSRLARFSMDGGQIDQAEQAVRDALSAALSSGDPAQEVAVLRLSAELAREKAEPERALLLCDQALSRAGIRPELLAPRGTVLVQRAILLRRLGRLDEALAAYAEALAIFRRLRSPRREAYVLGSFAIALATAGDFEDALALIQASIHIDRDIGDRMRLGRKIANLGQLYIELGENERARRFLARAMTAFGAVEDVRGRADALVSLAEITLVTDPELAADHLEDAFRWGERAYQRRFARERIVRALYERAMGRSAQACSLLDEGLALARQDASVDQEAMALAVHASVRSDRSEPDEALRLAREARAILGRSRVRRAEFVMRHLCTVLSRHLPGSDATAFRLDALRLVEGRADRIRNSTLRDAYLQSADVSAIRAVPS